MAFSEIESAIRNNSSPRGDGNPNLEIREITDAEETTHPREGTETSSTVRTLNIN